MTDLRQAYLRVRQPLLGEPAPESVAEDLARYRKLALELGIADATGIGKQGIRWDPRSQFKCAVPRCRQYGVCGNCPPHTPGRDIMEQVLERYSWALFLRWDLERSVGINAPADFQQGTYRALATLEAAAFYDGYYYACAFNAGSCKRAFCAEIPCRALTEPDKGCRFPMLARPSMESAGFDVYGMAVSAGWDVTPAGKHCPEEVETIHRFSLLLLA